MDLSFVTSSLGQIAKIFGYLGAGALAFGWVYTIIRTGSLYLLRRRIWQFVHGKQVGDDPDLLALAKDQAELEAYCYEFGFRVRSLGRAKLIAGWMRQNDESPGTVKRLGEFYDRDRGRMVEKLPTRRWLNVCILLFTGIGLLLSAAVVFGVSSRAYFTVTATGFSFSATSTEAQGTHNSYSLQSSFPWLTVSDPPKVSVDMCKTGKFSKPEFSVPDRDVICQLLVSPERDAVIKHAVTELRVGLSVLSIPAVVALFLISSWISRMQLAWSVQRRIQEGEKARSSHESAVPV